MLEWSRDGRKSTERIVGGGVVDVLRFDNVAQEYRRPRFVPVFPRRCQRHRERRLSAAHARVEQIAAPSYVPSAVIRLPLPTFKKPTTRLNGDALRCARLGHLEKAEEIAGAVPKERLVHWCGPVGPRAEGHRWGHGAEVPQRIPGHSRAALSLSKNVGGCRGMETDGYAPILLNANTSRLSSASHLCTFSSTSWVRPRVGRAHQARATRR